MGVLTEGAPHYFLRRGAENGGVQVDFDDQAGVSQSDLESLACDDETTSAAYVPLDGLGCGRQG
ncbi:hypothetical protein [Streptomyces sp. NPDC002328]|uniref:hypothetical protein n=1 Tax=Streptomyces sp. NPDC002328 TaxID=3364642 RepID=UPI0036785A63